MESAAEIVQATDLPVVADLEDGFGITPLHTSDISDLEAVERMFIAIDDAWRGIDILVIPAERMSAGNSGLVSLSLSFEFTR